jgi:hypothetical protein
MLVSPGAAKTQLRKSAWIQHLPISTLNDAGEQEAKTGLLENLSPQIQTALKPAPHNGFPRFRRISTGQQ